MTPEKLSYLGDEVIREIVPIPHSDTQSPERPRITPVPLIESNLSSTTDALHQPLTSADPIVYSVVE